MNKTERLAILRAQRHGWVVTHVGEELILMERAFFRPSIGRVVLGIWPDGRASVVHRGKPHALGVAS